MRTAIGRKGLNGFGYSLGYVNFILFTNYHDY